MSFAAIVIGLMVWFSFPCLFDQDMSEKAVHWLRLCCKYLGIAIIAGGVIAGFF